MTKQETTSLTQTFGASLGHIQHHPAVKVSASLDSEQVEAASNELSELLFDPYISRLYHFELSLSAQVRILHVATCRARQHIGRIFGQNHHKPREVAPIYIILSPPRAPDSFLSFSQAVNLLKDHLQLKEPPVADASNRRLHFPSLRLYLLDASAKPLQDQFHHQTAQSSSPSLDGPTGASLLLDTLRADQCDEGQAQFIWHNHASMTLLASVLRSQSFTSATYHFRAVLAADPLLMDMGTAASFAHKIVAQSSSWHHVMKHCKHHNTLFISTHLFLAGLGNKELADLPQWEHSLDLDVRDSALIQQYRQDIRARMSTALLHTTQLTGACKHVYGTKLAVDMQNACLRADPRWTSMSWTHAAAGIGCTSKILHPVSNCSLKRSKRNVHAIANVCGNPLTASLASFSTAAFDEFAIPTENQILFLPVDVDFERQRMIVGREETRHFILARSSLPQLGEHFSEVLRWQKTRPQILSAPTASTAPRQHIIDDQLAIEWSVFVRVMAKQLQVSLQTILEMDDFEEQGTWLQVVSELESAASNLMYGPMTEKCQDVLDEADLRQEAAAAARSTETNSDSH